MNKKTNRLIQSRKSRKISILKATKLTNPIRTSKILRKNSKRNLWESLKEYTIHDSAEGRTHRTRILLLGWSQRRQKDPSQKTNHCQIVSGGVQVVAHRELPEHSWGRGKRSSVCDQRFHRAARYNSGGCLAAEVEDSEEGSAAQPSECKVQEGGKRPYSFREFRRACAYRGESTVWKEQSKLSLLQLAHSESEREMIYED